MIKLTEPKIIYEDNHVLVAQKPPNMLTQGDATGDMDMLSFLKNYIKTAYNKPGEAYLGLVHRMDRPVGGLLCFAKTSKSAARLSKQLQNKEMEREYLCVVKGELTQGGRLEDTLFKDSLTNQVKVVPPSHPQGKKAILTYEPLLTTLGQTLLHIRLQTGRSHQIRVQLSNVGHPLVGDRKYGNENSEKQTQIALWGFLLSFIHPTKKEKMTFFSYPEGESWLPFHKKLTELTNHYKEQGALINE